MSQLNRNHDPKDEHHVVRSFDHFSFKGHLCIVFELLGKNLFQLLDRNHLKGIPLNLVRIFSKQLLKALTLLRDAHVIHCDLKPENILLTRCRSNQSANIKLIDFGSACMEHNTVYTYIQSRFYRSPEVLLGHTYLHSNTLQGACFIALFSSFLSLVVITFNHYLCNFVPRKLS
jgi:dual specificity protein kinase YAK1